jgi:hypothetical protein
MPEMHYSAWYPFIFLALALAGSLTVATRRGLRTWRTFRAFSSSTEQAIGTVNTSAEQAEAHAAAFTAATERLERAQARLQESLAELAVLRAAAEEVRASLAGVRGLIPRRGRA